MKDRIKRLMESQHMTQQDFADYIGISSASLSSIFTGRTKPTLNTVEAIKGKYPTISLDWLMYGKEPMFPDTTSTSQKESQGNVIPESVNLFNDIPAGTLPFVDDEPQKMVQPVNKERNIVQTSVKYIDKPQRNITEIRIFFDDQTWETFVPKK